MVFVEKNIPFLDLNLKGYTLPEAKKLVIDKVREFEEEAVIIEYEDIQESFLRREFCKIDLDKTLYDLFVLQREPVINFSRQDFAEMINNSNLPSIVIDEAFPEVLKGKTLIRVNPTHAQILKQDSFILPIKGATLPREKAHLPNASRPYRAGKHMGVDFFTGFVSVPINYSTEVFAVYDGEILRIDHKYSNLTYQEWKNLSLESIRKGYTTPENLDKFMGRQIHIKHPNGIKTVYAHLSWVRNDLKAGDKVKQGELIAKVGNSGTGGGFPHLHFEIWINDEYLGKGLTLKQVIELYEYYFREW